MITLSRADAEALAAHAESRRPHEACAVLLGRGGRVSRVAYADNADLSATSFAIPGAQLARIYGEAEARGEEVVGIFHSHPDTDAYPSGRDVEFMRSNPVTWVIYSGADSAMRAYELGPDVAEVPVEVA